MILTETYDKVVKTNRIELNKTVQLNQAASPDFSEWKKDHEEKHVPSWERKTNSFIVFFLFLLL